MYIFHKQITPTKYSNISSFLFHPSLEKPSSFRYNYGFKSSKFEFPREIVFVRLVKGMGHTNMIKSFRAQSLRGSSKTSNTGDHIGVKAVLQEQVSTHNISEYSPNNFSVADLECTLNHLSKWLLMTLLGTVLICRNDNEALWVACGSVVNAAISTILKKIINQDRPVSNLKSDPGMPSSHSQSIFFTIIFTITTLFQCHGTDAFTIFLSGITLVFGLYLSRLRITQEYHTTSQVVVGAVLGTIFSIFWLWSWDSFVHEAYTSTSSVRVIVDTGAVAFWIGFLMYISRHFIVPQDHNM